MAETKQDGLTKGELDFMKHWQEVMRLPHLVTSQSLDKAASLLGINRTGNCSACMRTDGSILNNRYRLLLPVYQTYLELLNTPKPEVVEVVVKKKDIRKRTPKK